MMNIRYFSSQQQAITNPGSRLLHSQTIVVEVYLARTVDSRKCEEEKIRRWRDEAEMEIS